MVGLVLGGVVWARIADFIGNRLLVRLALAASALAPLAALAVFPFAGTHALAAACPAAGLLVSGGLPEPRRLVESERLAA
jgi:MFS family permease